MKSLKFIMTAVIIVIMLTSSLTVHAAEPDYYYDANYIADGTYGAGNKPAHEYWRHSEAAVVKEDGTDVLKMVAAADAQYPTQVNIYWADTGSAVANGGIDLNEYPIVLMRYKTTMAAKYQLVTGPNSAYYAEIGETVANEWADSIVNLKTGTVTKGSFLQVINEMRIRFWGEVPSDQYIGETFFLEFIAFFKTEAEAKSYAESRPMPGTPEEIIEIREEIPVAAQPEPIAAPVTVSAPQTGDITIPVFTAILILTGFVIVKSKKKIFD